MHKIFIYVKKYILIILHIYFLVDLINAIIITRIYQSWWD